MYEPGAGARFLAIRRPIDRPLFSGRVLPPIDKRLLSLNSGVIMRACSHPVYRCPTARTRILREP